MNAISPDPDLDLVLERVVDVPPHLVWMAWTQPEHLKPWFAPKPVETTECEIDLRPGGKFRTVMKLPDGQVFDGTGCYLEVVENERLVWTTALGPGYRPHAATDLDMPFTAVLTLTPEGDGTRFRALAIHADPEAAKRHDEMGFTDGWGTALQQLVDYVKAL
ncbi:MAG TPA: SRPBCC family protein [Acidimicrobiia bacterium]|nr:SRPBCC family protein [Acidimicrobiia bacterium]